MTENTESKKLLTPYNVAAGLLKRDFKLTLFFYALIILPHLASFYIEEVPALLPLILERFFQLLFLTLLTLRWIKIFRRESVKTKTSSVLLLFTAGSIVWLALIIPFLIHMFGETPPNLNGIALLMLIPAFYLLNKYFFYFFPVLNGRSGTRNILETSYAISSAEPNLPLKTLSAPIAIFSLVTASLVAFSPDGRHLWASLLVSLSAGIFWYLHCYLALAAALLYCPEKEWREYGLDPYREAHLTSIALQALPFIASILSPKRGFAILIISLLVWFANMLALEALKPAPSINLNSAQISGENVLMELKLQDKDYFFRGFQPAHFSLSGENGAAVCPTLIKAEKKGESKDHRFILPETPDSLIIEAEFKCLRKEDALKKLEDLFLWYRGVKLFKVKL